MNTGVQRSGSTPLGVRLRSETKVTEGVPGLGCGLCAEECQCGAIEMLPEPT